MTLSPRDQARLDALAAIRAPVANHVGRIGLWKPARTANLRATEDFALTVRVVEQKNRFGEAQLTVEPLEGRGSAIVKERFIEWMD